MVERLAVAAVRQIRGDDNAGIPDAMVPVALSPLYQPVADAIRAALREIGRDREAERPRISTEATDRKMQRPKDGDQRPERHEAI